MISNASATADPRTAPNPHPVLDGDALDARGLHHTYAGAHDSPPALAGVDVTVGPGESVAVMGPSGSGKTTLLHVLAGIVAPTSGTVTWRGKDLARLGDGARTALRRSDFGFVFQSGHLLPELPAGENVALPLMLGGVARAEATRRAAALFGPLGLAGLERRRPGELSGGQAQRVAIARALAGRPGVVFADEPTGALDQQTSADVMAALTDACRHHGAALVVVTHDDAVAAWCARTIRLRDGVIVADDRGPRRGGDHGGGGGLVGDTGGGARVAGRSSGSGQVRR